ncbi:MAG: hypothetical protein ACE5FG_11730 [Myxococcota bacterium]
MPAERIPGSFRLAYRSRPVDVLSDPLGLSSRRIGRILASIQRDLDAGAHASVRQILRGPCELYRLEVERPDLAYQRTTILDRDTLDTLLEQTSYEILRERFRFRS